MTIGVFARVLAGATLLLPWSSVWGTDYPEFPTADFMDVTVAAGNIDYNGVPMRIFRFRTGESVESVEQFYNSEWKGSIAREDVRRWKVLSHRKGDFLLTVQIRTGETLVTHGTLSAAPVFSDSLEPGGDLGEGVNTMPGARVINDIRAVDGGKSSRTLVLAHPDSVRRTADYYQSLYEGQGWATTLGGTNDLAPSVGRVDVRALGFEKGRRRLDMAFSRLEDETYTVMVFVEQGG